MKKIQVILILLIIFVLTIFGTFLFYYTYVVLEVKYVPLDMTLIDGPSISLNVDTSALNFTSVTKGALARRSFTVQNSYINPISVDIIVPPELASVISVEDSSFILSPSESKNIGVFAYGNESMPLSHYTGNLKIVIRRVFP